MEYEIGHFCQSQQTVVIMKELITFLLILLFFSSCFCQIKGKQRNQKKTLIVKHNTKRWEIKTGDDGTHEKGKDYWHHYDGEYDDIPLSTPLKPEFDGYLEFHGDLGNPMTISNALLLHKLLLTKRGEQVVQRKTELNRRLVEHTFELNYTYASENILLQIAGRNKNTHNASDKDPTESRRDLVSKVRFRIHLRFRLQMKFLD